jgi:hypothetical protein
MRSTIIWVFFEEIGLYFHRNLVDVELVDEILGDSIIGAWEDDGTAKQWGLFAAAKMIRPILNISSSSQSI